MLFVSPEPRLGVWNPGEDAAYRSFADAKLPRDGGLGCPLREEFTGSSGDLRSGLTRPLRSATKGQQARKPFFEERPPIAKQRRAIQAERLKNFAGPRRARDHQRGASRPVIHVAIGREAMPRHAVDQDHAESALHSESDGTIDCLHVEAIGCRARP